MKRNYILFLLISVIMNTNIVFGMDFLNNETIDMTYKSILNLEEIPQPHPYSFYDYGFGFCDDINPIMSYLNSNGTYSVCINNKGKDIKIYELNSDDTISKELSFKRVSDNLGAFTKDKQGNYYLLFGMNGDTAYTLIKYKTNGTEGGRLDLSVEESDTTQPFL